MTEGGTSKKVTIGISAITALGSQDNPKVMLSIVVVAVTTIVAQTVLDKLKG